MRTYLLALATTLLAALAGMSANAEPNDKVPLRTDASRSELARRALIEDLGGVLPAVPSQTFKFPADATDGVYGIDVSHHNETQMAVIDWPTLTGQGVFFPSREPTVLGPDGNRLVSFIKDRDGVVHLDFIVKGTLGQPLDWTGLTTGTLREAIRQAMARNIQKVLNETEQKPVEEEIRSQMDSLGR